MRPARRWRHDERGVAMVTVLFVGAVLTAVTSAAAVVTIGELRSSVSDRKAAEALSYAEAGVDRLMLELKRGSISWGDISEAGCAERPLSLVTGAIGANGTYDVALTVYEPSEPPATRVPPSPWSVGNDSQLPCTLRSNTPPRKDQAQYFAITSTGRHPTAKRIVRQIIKISGLGLPIGLYADRVNANGNGAALSISLVTPGDVQGREKIGFTGIDPYYVMSDFYGETNADGSPRYPGVSTTAHIPAAAHALGSIYYVKGGGNVQEHPGPPNPNCDANDARGDRGQSVWDGSGTGADFSALPAGCSPIATAPIPPTSRFTTGDLERTTPSPTLSEQDYQTLKQAAQSSGLYCSHGPTGNNDRTCRLGGAPASMPGTIDNLDLTRVARNFVAYFDYAPGTDPFSSSNQIKWKDNQVVPCSDDPAVHRSVILIVRNGSISMESGAEVTGAILIPEGRFDSAGSYTTHGTIIAKELVVRGGANMVLSECWVQNLPGAFLDVTPDRWSEVDR